MARLGYPRQAVCVTCRAEADIMGKKQVKDNIITLTWHMFTSFKPELYAISVAPERFSYSLIKNSGVFCINFMPCELKGQLLFCGRNSGRHMDKFKETGLAKAECEKIDCCRIKDAGGYLECEVVEEIKTGDHSIFIGRVLKRELINEDKRVFQLQNNEFTTTVD